MCIIDLILYILLVYVIGYHIYIHLPQRPYNNNVRFFSKLLKTHFLLSKYFAAISVASSVQVTLQLYFQIFYSTALIKLSLN